METKAQLKSLRMSPRKVRLVTDVIRGLQVDEALNQLQFSTKDAALPVKKLLDSAIANAVHNHNMSRESLVVGHTFVNGGAILYRWMPRAMGRATPIRKRTSHITIVLEGEATEKEKVEVTEEAPTVVEGHIEDSTNAKPSPKKASAKTSKTKK